MRKVSGAARLLRTAPIRKSLAFGRQVPRHIRRRAAKPEAYRDLPPILANSFPKSGTHLLLQIVEAIPGVKNYGSFIASMPTITFRERSADAHLRRIAWIIPSEAVPAHLFYDLRYADALAARNCVHYFVYRDPRDVAVSEAHYLTTMNRWHRLHRYFARLPTLEQRIEFSIRGADDPDFPYDYPDIGRRFERYRGWLTRQDVFPLRYEELIGDRQKELLRRIVQHYAERAGRPIEIESALAAVDQAIDPSRSHTFRKGVASGWREVFTPRLSQAMKQVASDLLIELGYESDREW